jgi:hypothetical protein
MEERESEDFHLQLFDKEMHAMPFCKMKGDDRLCRVVSFKLSFASKS